MIYFDATKTGAAGPGSGLRRVSARLREELGAGAAPVSWAEWDRRAGPGDWFLTSELFAPEERPGFAAFLAGRSCRCAAIFHDAIPLRHPDITWPQSVARHPAYLKMLAGFDRIWAVSEASRADLLGFWRWQGIEAPPPVEVIALGADFDRAPRAPASAAPAAPALLCVGIVEPRKNQGFLLEVAASLWREGLDFALHVAGRVNPHFGRPIEARLRRLAVEFPGLRYHGPADDAALARLYGSATATAFPTRAEGCGLPLLESLWRGVPCVCTALPVLHENAAGGGCLEAGLDDLEGWRAALRTVLTDAAARARLAGEAASRPLPTWAAAAAALQSRLTA
ncbi:MAG TPA: glycosyltransferase [Opitutaceae bacterium]|nr:glycosyltransferase [Opitutaceae bacterium]